MTKSVTVTFFALNACKTFAEDKQDKDSRGIWNFTLPVTQLPKGIPLDPNARLADEKRSTVKKMLGTLAQSPKDFIFYNNGILMVADSISVKGRGQGGGFDVELVLIAPDKDQEEEFISNGIVNGGHTYLSIMKAREAYDNLQAQKNKSQKVNPDTGKVDFMNLEEANVQVSVLANISDNEIPQISRYRNTSEKVEEFSLKNLAKEWDIIKENLPPECDPYVAFRDGESKPFDVTDIVRRLACINVKVYPWQGDENGQPKHPVATCSAYGSLIKNWKKADFQDFVSLIKDVLYIEERLRAEYDSQTGLSRFKCIDKKRNLFITGKEFEHTIPITFVFPILAAFRVFIKDGQWEKPVEELWNAMGSKLVTSLLSSYRAEGRGNPAAFGRSFSTWSNLLLIPMQLKLTSPL
jgi:AIPR protein